ncbi:MAG: CGNR zinc finger domain-containing protein [Acidobacteria bacterium]|nr:CGNR zinc finger domain-containing protein [Acidobacteriota bacterium]
MSPSAEIVVLLGGRLAVDFANAPSYPGAPFNDLSWEEFIGFLEAARIVSSERSEQLLTLPETDPRAAHGLLTRATKLRDALREIFSALVKGEPISPVWTNPINDVLRITEGHDELTQIDGRWKLQFVARETGLDWLLAAVARSAAEIMLEGEAAKVRVCANPACGMFFCDKSRTHKRRWCSMAICGNRNKVATFARRRFPSAARAARA